MAENLAIPEPKLAKKSSKFVFHTSKLHPSAGLPEWKINLKEFRRPFDDCADGVLCDAHSRRGTPASSLPFVVVFFVAFVSSLHH